MIVVVLPVVQEINKVLKKREKYGIGEFSLKLFRLAKWLAGKCENFAIVTDGQWELELLNLISDKSSSKLNGKCGTLFSSISFSVQRSLMYHSSSF